MTSIKSSTRASSAASQQPASEADVHVVKPGDTLWDIAKDNGVSLKKLEAANPQIKDPNLIFPGQHVKIPAKAAPAPAEEASPAAPARKPVDAKVQQGARQQAQADGIPVRERLEADLAATQQAAANRPVPHGAAAEPAPTVQSGQPAAADAVDAVKIPKTGNKFIDKYMPAAIATQKATGVPASVTMAQAIVESGWGKSSLTKNANNFFGIKGTGPAGSVKVPTREEDSHGNSYTIQADFRKYHNATESFSDHAKLLSTASRYKTAMRHKDDPEQFARDIKAAGYATAHDYADTLISIMRSNHLEQFDKYGR